MVIVETPIFTRQVMEALSDDEYRQLQAELAQRPNRGVIIQGSGGLRKIRWAAKGHGKRGGMRLIYYWAVVQERVLMLFLYPKNERDDLSSDQLRILRKLIEEEYP